MSTKLDRIDAKTELLKLATEAEALIVSLNEAYERSIHYRLAGNTTDAAATMTEYSFICRELEKIGLRQISLISQLESAGEIIHLNSDDDYIDMGAFPV